MADNRVNLLTVAPLAPYNKGEVFAVGPADAAKLLASKKVVEYDPKKEAHVKALRAQRGKE